MENIFSFEERAARCALNRIFGFLPVRGAALIEAAGNALNVFGMEHEELAGILGQFGTSKEICQINPGAFESAAIELEDLHAKGYSFVCRGEKGYPPLLDECNDPPIGLYSKGITPLEEVFQGRPAIAIVGTRNFSPYGKDWCIRIVKAMASSPIKPLIVSGLAYGVDITAHRAALEEGLPTAAIMATGIDMIYPGSHWHDGERIASTEGCALISDYPPRTSPARINFLRRNRLIAGMCGATMLIESKIKGGGMMTARLAFSYGRDLFALPGRLDDPFSQGCNLLIKENIAEPIGDLGSFMERLGLGNATLRPNRDFLEEITLFYRERLESQDFHCLYGLAAAIKRRQGISLDELCSVSRLDFSKVSRMTAMMECDGFIKMDLLQHCSCTPGRF